MASSCNAAAAVVVTSVLVLSLYSSSLVGQVAAVPAMPCIQCRSACMSRCGGKCRIGGMCEPHCREKCEHKALAECMGDCRRICREMKCSRGGGSSSSSCVDDCERWCVDFPCIAATDCRSCDVDCATCMEDVFAPCVDTCFGNRCANRCDTGA